MTGIQNFIGEISVEEVKVEKHLDVFHIKEEQSGKHVCTAFEEIDAEYIKDCINFHGRN